MVKPTDWPGPDAMTQRHFEMFAITPSPVNAISVELTTHKKSMKFKDKEFPYQPVYPCLLFRYLYILHCHNAFDSMKKVCDKAFAQSGLNVSIIRLTFRKKRMTLDDNSNDIIYIFILSTGVFYVLIGSIT